MPYYAIKEIHITRIINFFDASTTSRERLRQKSRSSEYALSSILGGNNRRHLLCTVYTYQKSLA